MGNRSQKSKAPSPPSAEGTWPWWKCFLIGLVIGWGGMGGTLAIVGFQERGLATASYYFLRAGLVGVPLGLFIGLFTYLNTRKGPS